MTIVSNASLPIQTVASTILGFAFILKSIPLTVVGGVLLLAGFVLGAITHIMDDAY